MKKGKTLVELAHELKRQSEVKLDVVAPTTAIKLIDTNTLEVGEHTFDSITDSTHGQIGTFLDIPKKYYAKMQADKPELLVDNVNSWLETSTSSRMVRTMEGTARAFLSDRYRRIDNDIVANMALETLLNMPNVDASNVISCEVTNKKLYLKIIFDHISGEIKVGDQVESGILITNSEIGLGGFNVKPFINRLVCLNGMVVNDASISKRHIGTRLQSGLIDYQDDTVKADDQALMLELRDTLLASANQDKFNTYVDIMRAASESETIASPVHAVEVLSKTYGLNETEKFNTLENLIKDQDYSQWGALNAITKVANTHEDYDRATELEAIGGQVLDLNKNQWHEVIIAA